MNSYIDRAGGISGNPEDIIKAKLEAYEKRQAYAAQDGAAGKVPHPKDMAVDVRESPLERVSLAGNEVANVRQRLEALAERLIGGQPENAAAEGRGRAINPYGGVVGALGNIGDCIIDHTERMNYLLTRIEESLP